MVCMACNDPIGSPPGARIRRLWVPRVGSAVSMLAFASLARRVVRRIAPDVSLGLSRVPGLDVYRAGGGCHRAYLDTLPGWRVSVRHRVELALDRACVRSARAVVANAPAPARQLADRYGVDPARVRVVPNGVDARRFRPDPEARRDLRRDLGVPDEAIVALFLGDGFRRKGLATALEVAARMPGRVLWVAGGDRTGHWRRRARQLGVEARFLGHRRDPERLLAAADALLLPTRYDAASNVVLEAMAAGTPPITSRSDGASAFLPEPWMAVGDPTDARGFAEALERALRTPHLGDRCRAVAEAMPWSTAVEAVETLLQEVARGRRNRTP